MWQMKAIHRGGRMVFHRAPLIQRQTQFISPIISPISCYNPNPASQSLDSDRTHITRNTSVLNLQRSFSTNPPSNFSWNSLSWDDFNVKRKLYWGKFVAEMKHYWAGSKLLYYQFKVSGGLLKKLARGETLSRREKRQLIRSASDLVRLVPFIFFVVVPFAEFTLPFFLKLFPNMLPSTFHDNLKKDEEAKKLLKARIEIAKFLQQAVEVQSKNAIEKVDTATADEFHDFMERVKSGRPIQNSEIVKFARLLEEDFTLDNLSNLQLIAMCKYMGINPYGTDAFLRYQLSRKIDSIKADDKEILEEGIESLSISELEAACAARGIKGSVNTPAILRHKLLEWIDLSLNKKLPVSLLILSNAFKIMESMTAAESLKETLFYLPDALVAEIQSKIKSSENDPDAAELKLKLVKSEMEKIKEEEKEKQKTKSEIDELLLRDWVKEKKELANESVNFSKGELKKIADAVAELVKQTSVKDERVELEELATLVKRRAAEVTTAEQQMQKQLAEMKEAETFANLREKEAIEKALQDTTTAAKAQLLQMQQELKLEHAREELELEDQKVRAEKEQARLDKLEKKLEQWIAELKGEVDKTEDAIVNLKRVVDQDLDGVITTNELKEASKLLAQTLPQDKVDKVVAMLDRDKDGKINLASLESIKEEEKT